MRIKKKQDVIAAADVARTFNDERIKQLAATGRLSDRADRQRFSEGLREAARVYARDTRSPTVGRVRDEIVALYNSSERRQYGRVVMLLEHLSPEAHAHLSKRLELPSVRASGLKLPSVRALLDSTRRDAACEMIEDICRVGGRFVEGAWQPVLFAPVPSQHPPKREAERRFVMHLQSTWLEAVGKPPTATVNPSRSDRPFANLVRECLKLVGAPHADAVGLINELHQRRRDERQRLAPTPSSRSERGEKGLAVIGAGSVSSTKS